VEALSIDIAYARVDLSIVTRVLASGMWYCLPSARQPSRNDIGRLFRPQDLQYTVPVPWVPDHPVLDATASARLCCVTVGYSAGPPALELTRIGPQLPHPLGRRIELASIVIVSLCGSLRTR